MVVAVLVFAVAVTAIVIGRNLPRLAVAYVRFVRDHYRLSAQPAIDGQCARLRCTRAAVTATGYCSPAHELDDEYNAAGY